MWRSRLFWQLFSTSGLLVLFALAFLGVVVSKRVEDSQFRHAETSLKAEALTVQEMIRGQHLETVQELMNRMAQQSGGMRITLIGADGKVLAETERDPIILEIHAQRPEIVQAKAEGLGISKRFSSTLGQDLMYLALRTDAAGEVAYVRVALPLAGIQDQAVGLRRLIWVTAGVTAALSLALTFWLVRGFLKPLQDLGRGADLIASDMPGQRAAHAWATRNPSANR